MGPELAAAYTVGILKAFLESIDHGTLCISLYEGLKDSPIYIPDNEDYKHLQALNTVHKI
ncbi:hypothetical protein BYT27DRAFT_7252696 [Phlegmacium glaucopus]|nr:hypothetical protein BYT27DRAFT_7252696 [Phlegmacium glaucopus]